MMETAMPPKTADQLKARTAKLRKKLAEKAGKLDAATIRKAKKKIRRLQRRRRVMDNRAKRLAGSGEAKKAE
jgi:hypothetical protein